MTTPPLPSTPPTYECLPGTGLHALLTRGRERGASEVLMFVDGGVVSRRQSWVRYRVHGAFDPSEAIEDDARDLLVELRRHPPVDMTEPGRMLIHALTYDTVPTGDLIAEVVDMASETGRVRWQVTYGVDGSGAPHLLATQAS